MALLEGIEENSLLDLYRDMLEAIRKEPKDTVDKIRSVRLADKVDKEFSSLSLDKKKEFVALLVKEGLAPDSWVDLWNVFGGEYTIVTNVPSIESYSKKKL